MARISINGVQTYSTATGEDVASTIQQLTLLGQLLDVILSSVQDGQFIRYNSSTQEWENSDEVDGGTF